MHMLPTIQWHLSFMCNHFLFNAAKLELLANHSFFIFFHNCASTLSGTSVTTICLYSSTFTSRSTLCSDEAVPPKKFEITLLLDFIWLSVHIKQGLFAACQHFYCHSILAGFWYTLNKACLQRVYRISLKCASSFRNGIHFKITPSTPKLSIWTICSTCSINVSTKNIASTKLMCETFIHSKSEIA